MVIKKTCYPNKYRDFSNEVDARVDMWPMEAGCGIEDSEYYLRDIWGGKLLMDDQGKKDFAVILCGLLYSSFVILVRFEEETINPSQVNGLHVVGFGKKIVITLINWVCL